MQHQMLITLTLSGKVKVMFWTGVVSACTSKLALRHESLAQTTDKGSIRLTEMINCQGHPHIQPHPIASSLLLAPFNTASVNSHHLQSQQVFISFLTVANCTKPSFTVVQMPRAKSD